MSLRVHLSGCMIIVAILAAGAVANITPPMTDNLEWMGRIVVNFSEELGDINVEYESGIAVVNQASLDALARQYNVYRMEKLIPWSKKPEDPSLANISRYYILEFPTQIDLHEVAAAYADNPYIITAEPYLIRKLDYTPNDPYFTGQWGLHQINAEIAYDYAQGSEEFIIGIVDSGTDTAHQDLRNNLWINPGEDLNGNGVIDPLEWDGIDNEGNGFIDDFWGWNVWQSNNNVQDPPVSQGGGHGTHCAGDANAMTDNATGVASLGWRAKIMSARAGDGEYVYAGTAGINYCALNGANVISLSYGGQGSSGYEQTIINNAWNQGVLIFASAGNENNSLPHYPSFYDNVVSVAATDQNDLKADFSNYSTTVDICAPGVNINNTTPGNTYSIWSGTSFSCPMAAGLALLIWSAKPEWNNQQVLLQIYVTCVNIDAINPAYAGMLGWGRIDAGAALSTLFPNFNYTQQEFDDSTGNGDGRPDPGETVDLLITVENTSQTIIAEDVTLTLECPDPDITIIQGFNNLGNISIGGSANNHSDPFSFSVDAMAEAHPVTFTLTIEDGGTGLVQSTEIVQMIGRPDVIVVDDDGGAGFETWYLQDLDSLNTVADHWDVAAAGEISDTELLLYPQVIWHTSNSDNPISTQEEELIETFLASGGQLFLTGEDIDEQMAGTSFYSDVLHASSIGSIVSYQIIGVEGNPITSGDTLFLAGAGGANNNNSPATIEPMGDAALIFTHSTSGLGAGLCWGEGPGKLVYLSFCFEAASGDTNSILLNTTRLEALSSILDWLSEPPAVKPGSKSDQPVSFALGQNYPNPFNLTTEIAFSLPVASQVKLTIFDLPGRTVVTLVNQELLAGHHVATFNGTDLASGIYIYRIETEGLTASKKMILLK